MWLLIPISAIAGQLDVPLSEVGHQQARLAAGCLEHTYFTHVYSSDLARASQTAQAIVSGNKVCKCNVKKDKRLRERVSMDDTFWNLFKLDIKYGIYINHDIKYDRQMDGIITINSNFDTWSTGVF